jgi:hypothetical protein
MELNFVEQSQEVNSKRLAVPTFYFLALSFPVPCLYMRIKRRRELPTQNV